jgi:hypothetical protein
MEGGMRGLSVAVNLSCCENGKKVVLFSLIHCLFCENRIGLYTDIDDSKRNIQC